MRSFFYRLRCCPGRFGLIRNCAAGLPSVGCYNIGISMNSTESSLEYCCVSRWFAAGQLYAAATVTRLLADGPLRKGGGLAGNRREEFAVVGLLLLISVGLNRTTVPGAAVERANSSRLLPMDYRSTVIIGAAGSIAGCDIHVFSGFGAG